MDNEIISDIIRRITHLETMCMKMQVQLDKQIDNDNNSSNYEDSDSESEYSSDGNPHQQDAYESDTNNSLISDDSSYDSNDSTDSDFYKPIDYDSIRCGRPERNELFLEPKINLTPDQIAEVRESMEQMRRAALKQQAEKVDKSRTSLKQNVSTLEHIIDDCCGDDE